MRKVPLRVTSSTSVPLVVGHVDEVDLAAEPGVVDHDVDAVEGLGRTVDQGVDGRVVGHVADDRVGPLAHRFGDGVGSLPEAPLVVVGDDDPGALLRAALGRGEADAGAGGSGDDDALAGQQVVTLGIGRDLSTHGRGSLGRPRTCSPSTLRWIWLDPP